MDNINYKQLVFENAKKNNFFWSYSKDIEYTDISEDILIETVLLYSDMKDLVILFGIYPYDKLYDVWIREIIPDKRFEPENEFLAKFFFKVDLNKIKPETKMDRLKKLTYV